MLDYPKIYLASGSSRRQELLRQIGLEFKAIPADLSEQILAGELPKDYVLRAAVDKARFVARYTEDKNLPRCPVLGADTAIVLDGDILGKPHNRTHGIDMLKRLSGRSHDVLTAITIVYEGKEYSAVSSSHVTFAPLSSATIARYWKSGEPRDKAGGYAIQGVGAVFISRLEGSYSGVIGLPLYELGQLLSQIGFSES